MGNYYNNQIIRDVMELCGVSLSELPAITGHSDINDCEWSVLEKNCIIRRLFKTANYPITPPDCSSPMEEYGRWWRIVRAEVTKNRAADYQEVKGSFRSFCNEVQEIKRAGQRSNGQQEENNEQ